MEGRGQMPEGKQPIKSRMEIDKRKPSAFSLDSYQTMLRCRLWAWVWPRSKALLCAVTFLSTGLSCKTLEWKVLALGAAWE